MTPLALAVIGAGNWGTTLAHLAGENGHAVRLWTRDPAVVAEIRERRTNAKAAPALALSSNITATTSLEEALLGAELALFVIPAQSIRQVARAASPFMTPEQLVLHAAKGIELGSELRVSEILEAETCARQIGVVSGPNIASEIAAGMPAGTVIASRFPRVVGVGRRALSSRRFMVFASEDLLGVELAGALKNVVAIAAGMVSEMSLGDNAKSLLVTRGLFEIQIVAEALGASPVALAGLAGIGDLMVTCASPRSRNHRVGAALARGEPLDAILRGLGMVAEGVPTTRVAVQLAHRHGLSVPLMERVHAVLFGGKTPRDALDELMRLPTGWDVPRRW